MYGFQPKHARGKPAQALAGGGIVHSITGMLGMRKKTPEEMLAADAKVQERNLEAAARVAARAKPAQQAAPAEEKAVSDYAGMSAMQRREQAAGLKDGGTVGGFKPGGLIRGPGTGTSDSIETEKRPGTFIMPADSTQAIGPEALERLGAPEEMDDDAEKGKESVPVRLSNGEFELPPEQVQALGEAVLTVMRNATHQPADGKEAPTNKGFTPHQFFSGGGTVKDEEQQRLANQSAMYVLGAQTAAANRQPAPPEAAASQAQNQAPTRTAAPVATTAPTSAGFMPGTRAVFNESGKAIGDLANQGRYAAAAGETARAALAYVPAAVDDVVGGAVRAVGPALADAGKQFLGMNESTAPAPAPVPAAAAQKPSPAAPTGTTQANAAPTGQVAIQPMNDGAQPVAPPQSTAAAPQPQAEQVAPGAYRYGRGQYGDSPTGQQGMVSGPAGQPSAQNMAAADALAGRSQQESMNRVQARGFAPSGGPGSGPVEPGSFTGGYSGVIGSASTYGNMRGRSPEQRLRDAEVSASSIMNRPQRGGRGAENSASMLEYRAALAQDANIRQNQAASELEAMRQNAGITREGMQQDGATTRTGMQEQGSNAREAGRNALAQGEFGLKREAAGFQARALQQQEQLRNVLLDPKSTPEQRAVAQRSLAAPSGKTAADRMQTVALPDTTNEMGQVVRGGQALVRVLEDGTVQQVPIGAQQGAALPPGMKRQIGTSNRRPVYEDMNGKQVIAKG